ncbi:MAG: hypothetical protein ACI35R_01550 [Bacillus sp. (in: firmicutes)]
MRKTKTSGWLCGITVVLLAAGFISITADGEDQSIGGKTEKILEIRN